MAHDRAVMETASDASLCKLSASALGYFEDPFVQYFVKAPSRRMPIINRGYYARVAAIESLVTKFLQSTGSSDGAPERKQVVILGAGLDTMGFRLRNAKQLTHCEYFELDFPDVTLQKVMAIKKRKPLAALLGLPNDQSVRAAISPDCTELNAAGYHLLACDLRDIEGTKAKLEAAGVDHSVPTLFVSECVLIYMEARFSQQLIAWSSGYFADVSFALYEQILPDDAFGRVMMANINARGCDLLSIREYPTIEAQIERFKEHHFASAQCWDMNQVYYKFLDSAERLKREKLEIFDEVEEFHLLQAHYCVVVASNDASTSAARALAFTAH